MARWNSSRAPEVLAVVDAQSRDMMKLGRVAFTIAPDLVENTRLSLAHAIVAHAGLGDNDRETLKAAALDALQKHPPQLSVLG